MKSPVHKSAQEPRKPLLEKDTIAFVVFLLAWVALSMTAAQYLIALPMQLILGESATKPIWVLIYDLLVYAITLGFVIWLPPRLWTHAKKHHVSSKKSKVATESVTTAVVTTENPEPNPLSTSRNELGMGEFPTFVDIGLAPIGYVAYTILAGVLTTAMSAFSWFVADQPQDVGFGYFITTSDRIIAMLAIVLVAPIAEEIVMRGWLYGKMRIRVGAVLSTLLISVLFGFLHGQWNVAVGTFALSVVLCSLREITGTIWSGMLLHILSNGIAFYLLYIAI